MAHIAPLSYAWLVVNDTRVPVRVETRSGGAYRVEILGTTETRVVQRRQLIRVTPKTAAAFSAASRTFVDFPSVPTTDYVAAENAKANAA